MTIVTDVMVAAACKAHYGRTWTFGEAEGMRETLEEIIKVMPTVFVAEPTPAMLDAARDWSKKKFGTPIGDDDAIGCWKAMASAAPAWTDM